MTSSDTFAIVGEAVLNCLRRNGLWLLGRRCDVEVFGEIRLALQRAPAALCAGY